MGQDAAGPEAADACQPILLKQVALSRHWQTPRRFRQEYKKVARRLGDEFAKTVPSDRTVERWLNGEVSKPHPDACAVLEAMFPAHTVRQLFAPCADDNPPDVIDQANKPSTATATPRVTSHAGEEEEDVKRRIFLYSGAALAAAPGLVLSASTPGSVGLGDVGRYRHDVARLRELDHVYGSSDEVYSLTVQSMRHLVNTLRSASYTSEVGDQLRAINAGLMAHAGWLSFDAGRYHDAHSWYLKAQHAARTADDTDTEVYALNAMSLAAVHDGRGRDAVDLAQAAARIARQSRPTPRLLSLLATREADGHAHNGDSAATWRAFGWAEANLDRGRHDDDPAWLAFFGPATLATAGRQAAYSLGDLGMAERSARDSLVAGDQARYRRNYTLYQANLARVLAARGKVDEALPVVTGAAVHATQISSGRLTTRVRTVVRDLNARHGDMPAVRELVDWTSTNLPRPA